MARKTVDFSRSGIDTLPNDKPALYRIQTESGKTNYAGIAKRGREQERRVRGNRGEQIAGRCRGRRDAPAGRRPARRTPGRARAPPAGIQEGFGVAATCVTVLAASIGSAARL